MPKYTNSTNNLIVVGDKRFEPHQSLTFTEWLNPLPTGITSDAEAPFLNTVILSQKLTSTTTVALPDSNTIKGPYRVSIYVQTGDVSVQFNTSTSVARLIGAGDGFKIDCMGRIINSVIITISSGTAFLTVERI